METMDLAAQWNSRCTSSSRTTYAATMSTSNLLSKLSKLPKTATRSLATIASTTVPKP